MTMAALQLWLGALTVIALAALGIALALAHQVAALRDEVNDAISGVDRLRERLADVSDDTAGAVRAVNQVIDHLSAREAPSNGRHARTRDK